MLPNVEGLKQIALGLWRSAPIAVLGIGCYFLSLFMDNLWRYSGDLFWLAPEGIDQHAFAVRLFQFSAMALRALYCLIIAAGVTWIFRFFVDNKFTFTGVMLGALVWWILAIAETFSVIEYVLCKMVADHHTVEALSLLWQLEGQTSSCERFGGAAAAWALPTVTTLVLAWVLWRAYQVWRRAPHQRPTAG